MATLKPSTVHRVCFGFFCTAALYAVFLANLPASVRLVSAIVILCLAAHQLLTLSHTRTLIHQDEKSLWSISSASGSETQGRLILAGYRSAGLLVLVLQLDNGRCIRIVVWRDSVTPQQFSYLHHQLAFATTPARHNPGRPRGADR